MRVYSVFGNGKQRVTCTLHCEPTISENKNYLSYDDLKYILKQSLAALKKEEVELDDVKRLITVL